MESRLRAGQGRARCVPRRVAAAVLMLALCLAGAGAGADTLILYGGVGHVKGAWQPHTQEILTARNGGLADLRRSLGVAMERHARSVRFAWSDQPVAVTSDDVVQAIRTKDPGWSDPYPDIRDILDHFDAVYALVVVPTYEAGFVASGGSSSDAVDVWDFLVWTSAVLVELGSSEVKLAATALDEDLIRVDAGQGAGDATARIKDLIERSGRHAVDSLARFAAERAPADEFPMMFTGTIVADPVARSLFRYGKVEKAKRSNVCTMPSECTNEDCGRLIALVANAVAQNLTQRGVPVLPPINLNGWGERAEDRVALNLSLPRGAAHFEDQLSIVVGADSADTKLVPVVSKLRFVDSQGKSRLLKSREYLAVAQIYGFETDPDDCAKLVGRSATGAAVSQARGKVVADGPDQTALQRARLLGRLYDAFAKVDYDALY